MIGIKHTYVDVARRLAEGLESGSVVLDARASAPDLPQADRFGWTDGSQFERAAEPAPTTTSPTPAEPKPGK